MILMKELSKTMTPHDILSYEQFSDLLSHHRRSFLLQYTGTNIHTHYRKHAEGWIRKYSVLQGLSFAKPSSLTSGNSKEEKTK